MKFLANFVPISERIVGGEDSPDVVPYHCSIRSLLKEESIFICGCAIISSKFKKKKTSTKHPKNHNRSQFITFVGEFVLSAAQCMVQ